MRVIVGKMVQYRNEKAGKRDIPEKTRRPTLSSSTITTCENLGVTRPGIRTRILKSSTSNNISVNYTYMHGRFAKYFLRKAVHDKLSTFESLAQDLLVWILLETWKIREFNDLQSSMPMLTARSLSAVTVEGDDCPSFLQECSIRCEWSTAGMQWQGKREIPEETGRVAASSGTILTYENPVGTRPGIEPGWPWWEASSLTAHPPLPPKRLRAK
ncbi:hypothetical protein PR048_032730 [Dryococelus australis]|uniref:Uncharacterized protein n=1 Tax=Dryococelus australis TaxID=614101 RepID=A0ABQ9G3S8_9NEOP|nr:hypothetical protein PR048_032730 [Dryococelus australis]